MTYFVDDRAIGGEAIRVEHDAVQRCCLGLRSVLSGDERRRNRSEEQSVQQKAQAEHAT